MIHLFLILLKIIGILLLILVGLLLFVILSILFVPIRYQFFGESHKEMEGTVAIHWFLHLLSIRAGYKNKILEYSIKLFGITFASSNKTEKVKKSRKRKKEPATTEVGHLEEEPLENDEYPKEDFFEEYDEMVEETEEIQERKLVEKPAKEQGKQLEETVENKNLHQEQKDSLTKKSNKIFQRIKQVIQKVIAFFKGIPDKIRNINNNLEEIKQKIRGYLDFYKAEETQKAIRSIKNLVKKAIRHLLPRKLEATVCFGFEDPALTGQVLGMLSLGLPLYHDHLNLYPVFTGKVLEFDAYGKGYIRLGFFVWLALCALLDKNIRNLIYKGKTMFK